MARRPAPSNPPVLDGAVVIRTVLERTRSDVAQAETRRAALNERLRSQGRATKKFKPQLTFAIQFAKHMGQFIADALRPDFPVIKSGENPSRSVFGSKRVDINYNTPEMGLGLAMSFKSVHQGEEEGGNADFIHNMKRNDEELRVEATAHHLRQPYAVMVAVVFLPFESCTDLESTSSFASWVEYLWPLKGRTEPEDPPDGFELVFIALYARDGSELGFYHVGGRIPCPRHGRPSALLTLTEFLQIVKRTYDVRNGKDFFFEGEGPQD
jgi:hypothetical protein